MEELEQPNGSPVLSDNEEPQGNNDAGDPLRPEIEEDGGFGRTAPLADPTADLEAEEADRAGESADDLDDPAADGENDDVESELEELDEAQFDDFDPEAANINVPVQVDETNVAQLGVHKRKRTEEEELARKKKKKEGRREKVSKKQKKVRAGGDEDHFEGGVEMDGKRSRKSKAGGAEVRKRPRTPENEDDLSPEERRRRALERKMDDALRTNRPVRRRGGGIDLEAAGDAELDTMRHRMAKACEADAAARARGEVASHKLQLLPQVVELLNRNTLRSSIVDPDINILEAVRFFLEPADVDAALPNHQIQRELFSILSKLQMSKEALRASKIGMVVRFYTQSRQPQPAIKRQAEKLLENWIRIILNKRAEQGPTAFATKIFDPLAALTSQRTGGADRTAVVAERRRKQLEQPIAGNRARVEGGLATYTVAPVNNLSNAVGQTNRKLGASGEDAFRRIQARASAKNGGSKR